MDDPFIALSITTPVPGERNGYCRFCGSFMFIEVSGVSHHVTPGDLIDHDADGDHVAVLYED